MPSHQDRREPLPTGYQFGDAVTVPVTLIDEQTWALCCCGFTADNVEDIVSHQCHRNVTEGDRDIMDRYDHVLDGLEF